MVTPQQLADAALIVWQDLRSLPPEVRIEVLMREFFAPPPPGDVEYSAMERTVSEIMADA